MYLLKAIVGLQQQKYCYHKKSTFGKLSYYISFLYKCMNVSLEASEPRELYIYQAKSSIVGKVDI